jgi:hypothetical protein
MREQFSTLFSILKVKKKVYKHLFKKESQTLKEFEQLHKFTLILNF